jgi:hypothetical protein
MRIKDEMRRREGISIKFNKSFYSLESVKSACDQFREEAFFEVSNFGNYHRVTVRTNDKHSDFTDVLDEFRNYVLFLNISK